MNMYFEKLEKVFDAFDSVLSSNFNYDVITTKPSFDIIEKTDEYIIEIGLAGFKKENIKLDISDDKLTVSAEKLKDEKLKYTYSQTFYGKYEKTFKLPKFINKNKITAAHVDGILTIHLPINEINNSDNKINIEIK